jgi:hypothetical protein
VAGKAKYQQPAQVDRGDPQRPPRLVALDAAVGPRRQPSATSQAIERSTIGRQRR